MIWNVITVVGALCGGASAVDMMTRGPMTRVGIVLVDLLLLLSVAVATAGVISLAGL